MPENDKKYNVYNNHYTESIDAGNAAPILKPEKEEKELTNFQAFITIIRKNLAVVIAAAVITASLITTTAFYSVAVESNTELTSAQSTLSKKQITLNTKKNAYAAILADYDIDEEAEKLGMKKADESIGIILSEVTE